MDGGVHRPQLDHLGAGGSDEATVGGAAGGGQLGVDAGHAADGVACRVHQGAGGGEEGIARQGPVDLVLQTVAVEDRFGAPAQGLFGLLGGEAEIEHHFQLAGDHVGGAGAGVDVGDLEAGGREEFVALIPFHGGQLGQGRQGLVDRIAGQLGIGHMALHADHPQHAVEGAAPAVLDGVANGLGRGGLPHQTPVDPFAARAERFHHLHRAVHRRSFFIAGDEKGEAAGRLGVFFQKALHGGDHGGDGTFHVGGAAAVEAAVVDGGLERRMPPGFQGAGGHHVGVAGKA